MFAEIGALWVDHVAVTTVDFEETARHYLSMPNARVLRGPGWNSAQNVHFMFVGFGGDLCIEILGVPEDGNSPIATHAGGGGGAYHLCHAVADIDASVVLAQNSGAKLVAPPKADDAYDGRRVAFMMHEAHGLFELVEAYGDFASAAAFVPAATPAVAKQEPSPLSSDIEAGVKAAFRKIFAEGLPNTEKNWSVDQIERWDSLQHMRLMMEVERSFDVAVPSQLVGDIQSFDDVVAALSKLLPG